MNGKNNGTCLPFLNKLIKAIGEKELLYEQNILSKEKFKEGKNK